MQPSGPKKQSQTRAFSKKKQQEEGAVCYRVFGGGREVHEVASVDEFLASALTNQWIVLLGVSELPSGPNVWCPAFQPTLLKAGELSKQLKDTNCLRNLVVANASNPSWQPKIESIKAAELAFTNMQALLQAEDSSAKKHKFNKARTKGGKDRQDALAHVQSTELVPQAKQKKREDVPTKEDADAVNTQGTMGKDKEGNEEGQPVHKTDVFFADGKIVHEGKALSSLEMLAEVFKSMKGLQKGQQNLQKEVQKGLEEVSAEIKELNRSLSFTAERVSRLSLALLQGQCMGARVEYPVTTRWLPYDPVTMNTIVLEDLANLYKPLTTKNKPSGLVEVDILMKIMKEGEGHTVYTSPMAMKTSCLGGDRSSTFTHVVVGKSTRSMGLCACANIYQHPEHPCRTPSSKLLKKLVQVERGIVAALHYYGALGHAALVDGAVILSPSFKQLVDPATLLQQVLLYCEHALPNISRLAKEDRVWLIDG